MSAQRKAQQHPRERVCYERTRDAYHRLLDALTRQAAQADIDDAPGRSAKYRAECEAVRKLFLTNF